MYHKLKRLLILRWNGKQKLIRKYFLNPLWSIVTTSQHLFLLFIKTLSIELFFFCLTVLAIRIWARINVNRSGSKDLCKCRGVACSKFLEWRNPKNPIFFYPIKLVGENRKKWHGGSSLLIRFSYVTRRSCVNEKDKNSKNYWPFWFFNDFQQKKDSQYMILKTWYIYCT